jgi:hypothetical protein
MIEISKPPAEGAIYYLTRRQVHPEEADPRKRITPRGKDMIPGECTIYVDDVAEQLVYSLKKPKVKKVQGVETIDYQVLPVIFDQGMLIVNKDQKQLFHYMENCIWNKDSPYHTPLDKALFYRHDPNKSIREQAEKSDKLLEALLLIDKSDEKDVKEYALSAGMDTKQGFDVIKNSLKLQAMANPVAFLQAYNSPEKSQKAFIRRCQDEGILVLSNNGQTKVWFRTKPQNMQLHTVPRGMDEIVSLLEFLDSDTTGVQGSLNKFLHNEPTKAKEPLTQEEELELADLLTQQANGAIHHMKKAKLEKLLAKK